MNKSSLFSYDKGGNIIERIEYAYSTLPVDKLTGGTTFDYNYPISGWKDQLVKYNGENFVEEKARFFCSPLFFNKKINV